MAKSVVDGLEAVEINCHEQALLVVAAGIGQGPVKGIGETTPVEKAGELVCHRQGFKLGDARFLLGNRALCLRGVCKGAFDQLPRLAGHVKCRLVEMADEGRFLLQPLEIRNGKDLFSGGECVIHG